MKAGKFYHKGTKAQSFILISSLCLGVLVVSS